MRRAKRIRRNIIQNRKLAKHPLRQDDAVGKRVRTWWSDITPHEYHYGVIRGVRPLLIEFDDNPGVLSQMMLQGKFEAEIVEAEST